MRVNPKFFDIVRFYVAAIFYIQEDLYEAVQTVGRTVTPTTKPLSLARVVVGTAQQK